MDLISNESQISKKLNLMLDLPLKLLRKNYNKLYQIELRYLFYFTCVLVWFTISKKNNLIPAQMFTKTIWLQHVVLKNGKNYVNCAVGLSKYQKKSIKTFLFRAHFFFPRKPH